MKKLLIALLLLVPLAGAQNWSRVTASRIYDPTSGTKKLLAFGSLIFTAVDDKGVPLTGYNAGDGQAIAAPIRCVVVGGALSNCQVPDPDHTLPPAILYRIEISSTKGNLRYDKVSMAGDFDFDAYVPSTTPVYSGQSVDKLTVGELTITRNCLGCGSGGTGGGVASFGGRTGVVTPQSGDYAAYYAALSHTQAISTITGLQTALDAKQAAGSYVASSDLSAYETIAAATAALAAKADASHTQAISTITGLQTALDAKQASGSYVLTGDARLSDARTPLPHTQAFDTITGVMVLAQMPACSVDGQIPKRVAGAWQCAADATGAGGTAGVSSFNGQTGDVSYTPDLSSYETIAAATTALAAKADASHTQAISTITGLQTALDGKQAAGSYVLSSSLATVATTGSYTDLAAKPTIPAAQVQTDWNAVSGMGQILNKPVLFDGAYSSLTGKPTIPAAQVQSDWTQATTSALDYIKNKPTIPAAQVQSDWSAVSGMGQILNKPVLFDGAYASLTGKPTLPVTKTAAAGSPLLSYDSTTGAFTQGALTAANLGAVPTTRTVAGKALSADITLACADLSNDGDACPKNTGTTAGTLAAGDDSRIVNAVPNTRTVAGHALSADVTVSKTDVGLGNVDNTSDASKPVSTAQATAIAAKQDALSNATTIAKITESGGNPLWNGSAWPGGSSAQPFSAAFVYGSIPSSGTYLLDYIVPTYSPAVTITIPANCSGATFKARNAATASTALLVAKNGTTICTATVAISGTTATWTGTGSSTTLTSGDELTIVIPTADATLSGLTMAIAGTR